MEYRITFLPNDGATVVLKNAIPERASASVAGAGEAQLAYALDLLDWLRGYPDFQETGDNQGIVRTAIEEIFAGKRPSMLASLDYLAAGRRVPDELSPDNARAALAARPVAQDAPDAFPALQALTEALLTHADNEFLLRQIDAAVKVMRAHRREPPVSWPDRDFAMLRFPEVYGVRPVAQCVDFTPIVGEEHADGEVNTLYSIKPISVDSDTGRPVAQGDGEVSHG